MMYVFPFLDLLKIRVMLYHKRRIAQTEETFNLKYICRKLSVPFFYFSGNEKRSHGK